MKCQIEDCRKEADNSHLITDGETLQEILLCKECIKEVENGYKKI